jgi:hypothetical protein
MRESKKKINGQVKWILKGAHKRRKQFKEYVVTSHKMLVK